jgi:ribulose-phosphate 3-epimerase
MSQKLIAPSILSADFGNLAKEIELVNISAADLIHIDVMDGVFVPNISIGFPVIKFIKKYAKKPLDVHLMIVEPDKYIEDFKNIGADYLTVHYEACRHLNRTINRIKESGMLAGVSINPHTSVNHLENIITDADLVLIMSVNPGFGGQKFIENTYHKIEALKNLIIKSNSKCMIEVDGGVNLNNAPRLFQIGADILVAGYTIFNSENPLETIAKLKQ